MKSQDIPRVAVYIHLTCMQPERLLLQILQQAAFKTTKPSEGHACKSLQEQQRPAAAAAAAAPAAAPAAAMPRYPTEGRRWKPSSSLCVPCDKAAAAAAVTVAAAAAASVWWNSLSRLGRGFSKDMPKNTKHQQPMHATCLRMAYGNFFAYRQQQQQQHQQQQQQQQQQQGKRWVSVPVYCGSKRDKVDKGQQQQFRNGGRGMQLQQQQQAAKTQPSAAATAADKAAQAPAAAAAAAGAATYKLEQPEIGEGEEFKGFEPLGFSSS
ncbi:hypothetical protein Emag_000376 [Eimeria magna]